MTNDRKLPRSSDGRVSTQSTMRLESARSEGTQANLVEAKSLSPCLMPPSSIPRKKYKTITEILAVAKYTVVERADYNDVSCGKCGSGDLPDEILLCDKCDKGFHMKCLRPIVVRVPLGSWVCPQCCGHRRVRSRGNFVLVRYFCCCSSSCIFITDNSKSDYKMFLDPIGFSQKKIFEFFRIQKCSDAEDGCLSPQDSRKRRRRWAPPVFPKKRRRLLPFIPHEDCGRRLKEMSSLASALTASQMEFCDDLYYSPGLAPRSANQAKIERGGMQVLSKEDIETVEQCRVMCKRGLCPPLMVRFDSCEGFTVEADALIKDMTLITEYTGDVDFLENRKNDDCDGIMTLLLANDPSKSLVICPDKRGNIARFINGINNHTVDGKKKQNCKCVRYNVNGECRVFLVATHDIAEGERLYYDYNGYEHAYPTHHFI